MGTTFRFDPSAALPPYASDIAGLVAGDEAAVVFTVAGFLSTDEVIACYFTAKENTDADDSDPETIAKFVNVVEGRASPNCTFAPTSASGTAWKATIVLNEVDTTKLLTERQYEFRVFVRRGGIEYDRALVNGSKIVAAQGVAGSSIGADIVLQLGELGIAAAGAMAFAAELAPQMDGPALEAVGTMSYDDAIATATAAATAAGAVLTFSANAG